MIGKKGSESELKYFGAVITSDVPGAGAGAPNNPPVAGAGAELNNPPPVAGAEVEPNKPPVAGAGVLPRQLNPAVVDADGVGLHVLLAPPVPVLVGGAL